MGSQRSTPTQATALTSSTALLKKDTATALPSSSKRRFGRRRSMKRNSLSVSINVDASRRMPAFDHSSSWEETTTSTACTGTISTSTDPMSSSSSCDDVEQPQQQQRQRISMAILDEALSLVDDEDRYCTSCNSTTSPPKDDDSSTRTIDTISTASSSSSSSSSTTTNTSICRDSTAATASHTNTDKQVRFDLTSYFSYCNSNRTLSEQEIQDCWWQEHDLLSDQPKQPPAAPYQQLFHACNQSSTEEFTSSAIQHHVRALSGEPLHRSSRKKHSQIVLQAHQKLANMMLSSKLKQQMLRARSMHQSRASKLWARVMGEYNYHCIYCQ